MEVVYEKYTYMSERNIVSNKNVGRFKWQQAYPQQPLSENELTQTRRKDQEGLSLVSDMRVLERNKFKAGRRRY